MYSILKSSWIEAPMFVETLAAKLAHPPRLVVLATRLVMTQRQEAKDTRPPASPSVVQFRKLVHDPEFRACLTAFVEGDAGQIFNEASAILTETDDTKLSGRDYALPPVLAFELARKTPDILLLLLFWITRMHAEGKAPTKITELQRRRLLGFITALSWFAPDPTAAVTAIWPDLKEAKTDALPDFFNKSVFEKTLRLGRNDKLIACPLPTPEILELIIRQRVTEAAGFNQPDSDFWKKWNRYESLQQAFPEVLKKWFYDCVDRIWWSEEKDALTPDQNAKHDEVWRHFSNQLWDKKSLVLFAQRARLRQWFPDYDPTVPDQIEDKNRPWDWDHIHPRRYLISDSGSSLRMIPRIVWAWHGSIGNFRAWPLELNRADGDISPRQKFSDDDRVRKTRYDMKDAQADCDASFVGDQSDGLDEWHNSVPEAVENGNQNKRYLALDEHGQARQALVRAITHRFTKLYRHWYAGLRICDLMPCPEPVAFTLTNIERIKRDHSLCEFSDQEAADDRNRIQHG